MPPRSQGRRDEPGHSGAAFEEAVIGVDANVLVRYLVQDDAAQGRRVDAFLTAALEDGTRLHVDEIVMCELVWVLGAAYRLGEAPIAEALDKIMSAVIFSFDDRELLRAALIDDREAKGDLSDYVIARRNCNW